MRKLRVAVLCGGKSAEHDISLISAKNVLSHLDRKKYDVTRVFIGRDGKWDHSLLPNGKKAPFDVVFPVLHGPFGEDGTVQGLLELADLPYVGCGVLASAVGMDKEISYRLASAAGIPVPPFVIALRSRWKQRPAKVRSDVAGLGFPVFVKPARLGSSVGISKVKTAAGLARAMEVAFLYDDKVIVEKGINAREIECAVLGDADHAEVSIPGEVVTSLKHDFYSYSAKYLDPEGAALKIPAPLSRAQAEKVRDLAVRAFKTLDCHGLTRVDFLMDKKSGRFYFGEVNTLPGFTAHSLYPKLWEASGLKLPKLLDRLIALAQSRHQRRSALRVKP